MTASKPPLLLPIPLTEAQRQQILMKTGMSVGVLPYESNTGSVRCRFAGLTLRVTRGVFAPAPITQLLLDTTLRAVTGVQSPVIVDVGTGSGAVALAAAAARPASSVFATEVSTAALHCARSNRARLRLHNVRILHGSLLSPLPRRLRGRVSVIAANVPYVPPSYGPALGSTFPDDSVMGRGADGLGLVHELASTARTLLVPGGSLVLQLAWFQWVRFEVMLRELGYDEPHLQNYSPDAPVVGRVALRRRH